MRNLIFIFLLIPSVFFAQNEATFLSSWDDSVIPGSSAYNNRYNEVWGLVANNQEFAVIGSTLGTHFINVSDPNNITEVDFVEGRVASPQIIHRDFKDYECYLYSVADEGVSSLQIIDYSYLPDSVSVVYDSDSEITQAHNLYIDKENALLYAVGMNSPSSFFPLQVFSLADPTNPVPLGSWGQGIVGHVHDLYVKDNIAYLNCGGSGFYIVDFSTPSAPNILGSLTTYEQQGYNHSGWLSDDGNYYYLGDENLGLDIKVLDVSDASNIMVVDTIDAGSTEESITHNQIVRDDFLYTSYYFDGLQVFDISNPASPERVAYYDTYLGTPGSNPYVGAWGVYPNLPSGNILLSDMQTGLYVFEKWDSNISGILPELGTAENCSSAPLSIHKPTANAFLKNIYPLPMTEQLNLSLSLVKSSDASIYIADMTGRKLKQWAQHLASGEVDLSLDVADLPKGIYLLRIEGEDLELARKLVKM